MQFHLISFIDQFKKILHMIKGKSFLPKMVLSFCMLLAVIVAFAKGNSPYYYQLKIYHLANDTQENKLDTYLQTAYLPALHRIGIKTVGVFKPVQKDTSDILVYVFIPFSSFQQIEQLDEKLATDKQYQKDGGDYINAPYSDIPYKRIESVLLKAFPGMPRPALSEVAGNKRERIYELRSYEGPTEKYYHSKVKMFNDGDEIGLFKRLGFNAVFYAEVISGSHMPNLMYMTTFKNKEDRDEHWKIFGNDPQWKQLVAEGEYQHNVSKADIFLLYPVEYSDF